MTEDHHDQAQTQQPENDLLSLAKAAARAGRVQHARSLLGQLLLQTPDDDQAWLELARLYERPPAPDRQRTLDCLRQVLRIDPHNRAARLELRELERQPQAAGATALETNEAATPRAVAPTSRQTGLGARGVYLLAACALVILCTVVVLGWALRDARPVLAARTPTSPPTATPTVAPTATPTPSIAKRVAQQIPLLEQAWNDRDWQAALDRLTQVSMLDGDYPGLHAAQCDTYLHWAQDLEQQCRFQQAHDLYRRALAVCPDRDDIAERKSQAVLYLSGKWRYDHERWPQAAEALRELYDTQPNYAAGCQEPLADADPEAGATLATDVRTLLHASLVATSQQHMEQGKLELALQAAQAALELAPEDQDVRQLVSTIEFKLKPPPTPTPTPIPRPAPSTGKRIEISISKQRMYVYQGDSLIHDWVCSTGKPGSGTAVGQYQVQSKIPEAWAGQWSLRMPYWLGIYWVGSIENGIHALPIMSNGATLWAGYLGTPVSFGCIILSTENAQTLYQWAEIGTPVRIYY